MPNTLPERPSRPSPRDLLAPVPLAIALLAIALLVGVVALALDREPASSPEAYRLAGTFTGEATQDEVAAFTRHMEGYGANAFIMESYPLQFQVRPLTDAQCAEARAHALALPYVASVSACLRIEETPNPDAPETSTD